MLRWWLCREWYVVMSGDFRPGLGRTYGCAFKYYVGALQSCAATRPKSGGALVPDKVFFGAWNAGQRPQTCARQRLSALTHIILPSTTARFAKGDRSSRLPMSTQNFYEMGLHSTRGTRREEYMGYHVL